MNNKPERRETGGARVRGPSDALLRADICGERVFKGNDGKLLF